MRRMLMPLVCIGLAPSDAFSVPTHATVASNKQFTSSSIRRLAIGALSGTATQSPSIESKFQPIFDFTQEDELIKQKSAASFERIDDAIMGGISVSALRDVPDKDYASWSGVCRTDGGGFCGMRTLPFKSSPLNATGKDGIYLDCRLASDGEADRRMWKMTVRTDSSRGEMVYQAQFDLKKAMDDADLNNNDRDGGDRWARVMIPFDDFVLVRGPRLIPDGPKLNVTGGIYQIGMTMSKFKIAANTTELENFRSGFFEMHIKSIGFFNNQKSMPSADNLPQMMTGVPDTLSKKEAESKRPLMLKILLPVFKILFSEKANRRRSAMKILREDRNKNRAQSILFGIKIRRKDMGLAPSIAKTIGILCIDSFRSVLKIVLKIMFLYPLRLVRGVIRMGKQMLGMKVKPSLTE